MHDNHKLIQISDTDSLQKENISLESITKDSKEISQKINELKNKLENEINHIKEIYEKTEKEITKSFITQHECLIKEEKKLKEELKNKVTKTQEQLEIFLSRTINEIEINEKISKCIQKIEKEEKNLIKYLAYISKINNAKKDMNKLLQELMKNMEIKYEEEKKNVKYEEYYFNGIYIPKNVEFKDTTFSSFNITWKIDEINILNFDKNKLKFIIEMRKENEQFSKIYEGNDNNYLAQKLLSDTEYNIRITSKYNNIIGEWSQIYKERTKIYFESFILRESNQEKKLVEKIKEWLENKKLELIYRGTRDGMTNTNFFQKCENKGKTITIIKNDKNNIFGGYSSISFQNNDNGSQNAPDSFIFTLTNMHNTEPTKFPSKKNEGEIHYSTSYGPCFGSSGDLGLYGDFLNQSGWSYFPRNYNDTLGKENSIFTGDLNTNNRNFKIKEIEIFKVI